MIKGFMMPPVEGLWAITDEGLLQYSNAVKLAAETLTNANLTGPTETQGTENEHHLLERHGSVGIVSIRGPLVNTDNFITQMLGLTSYGAIQTALLTAVEDPNIDRILLDIDSPGGTTSGMSATAELISAIDKSVKPVFAATDGTMASAAYMLACGARHIYAEKLAQVGSIGVIGTVMEFSKAMEKEGVTATVLRAGKYKQMGNPHEPLSEEGKAEIQKDVDTLYKAFVEHVAEGRDKAYEFVDQVMAQGRVFRGQQAKSIGLVDENASFQAALAEVAAKQVDRSIFPYKITV